ncbi:hypothetical protein IVB11_02030 [Bradyrhizobium sp. 177]|uniref:hypothetical protein n=1 Tax=Bradyrhizobium sp. 177 TaxID=2782647 RepID=UPI001FF852E1|nr:hypothetical protein [Bradyrhizobium sp. 177]MCK1547857.1 hypothetical protein [Bradyrhizobium sp. 177]
MDGVNQLSTFVVPNTILGIVGLTQVVYIGGKLVTPTNISDLNAAIAGLRTDEQKLKAAAVTKKQGQVASLVEVIPLAGQDIYEASHCSGLDVIARDAASRVDGSISAIAGIQRASMAKPRLTWGGAAIRRGSEPT